ncbi:MAG TPA: DUF2085 domain-containing protein [Candidatus Bilamarchaeaceae archaeon]|nr:DUF2085 domain-containing protein [Candidatus Bilamarchaeaceae archaeon]
METGYKAYMAVLALFTLPILITPFLAEAGIGLAEPLYAAYGLTCHQFVSRSICYFPGQGISDCMEGGQLVPYRIYAVEKGGVAGYAFPVCSRDVGIYAAALLGGALLFLLRRHDSKMVPNPLFFVLALAPIALDGGTQLIGLRESSNLIRLLTGGMAGLAFSFYCVPLMNKAFSKQEKT